MSGALEIISTQMIKAKIKDRTQMFSRQTRPLKRSHMSRIFHSNFKMLTDVHLWVEVFPREEKTGVLLTLEDQDVVSGSNGSFSEETDVEPLLRRQPQFGVDLKSRSEKNFQMQKGAFREETNTNSQFLYANMPIS